MGDPDQVLAKLREYQRLGMDSFILSGYPHVAEGDLFARHVLPKLDHAPSPAPSLFRPLLSPVRLALRPAGRCPHGLISEYRCSQPRRA